MTPDLVALGRQVLETFSSGDLDTMMSFYAPDAVVSPTAAWVIWRARCRSVTSSRVGALGDRVHARRRPRRR
jgi:hypothetical protein